MNALPIRVSGVVLRDGRGLILTVRKRGTSRFMLPGGKPERGESARDAAARECREELGLTLEPEALTLVGAFSAPAANEPGRVVESTVYSHPIGVTPVPASEIDEVRWLYPWAAPLPDDLAPLLAQHVIPALRAADGAGVRVLGAD